MKGAKTAAKPAKVAVNIRPGQPSVAQKQAWKQFWQKLSSEVKRESDKDN